MSTNNRATGRPPKDDSRKRYFETELHALLAKLLPAAFISNRFVNAKAIAETIEMSRYHVYRHLSENRLSPKLAGKLINISNDPSTEAEKKGLITPEILARFVIEV